MIDETREKLLEIAVTLLALVALLEAAIIAVLASLVPAAWFRTMRHGEQIARLEVEGKQLREDVDDLDKVVDATLDAAGVSRPGREKQ